MILEVSQNVEKPLFYVNVTQVAQMIANEGVAKTT